MALSPEQINDLSRELEAAMHEESTTKAELAKLVQTRAQYASRLNENVMVDKEFGELDDAAKVYKLIGPVLVAQDLDEAKSNVSKRIQYISSEVARLDEAIAGKEAVHEAAGKKRAKVNQKIYQLQMLAQQGQQQMQQKQINAS